MGNCVSAIDSNSGKGKGGEMGKGATQTPIP